MNILPTSRQFSHGKLQVANDRTVKCFSGPLISRYGLRPKTLTIFQTHHFTPLLSSNVSSRRFTTKSDKDQDKDQDKLATQEDTDSQSTSIFKRFKDAYKKNGKVLVGVHLVTSSIWYGSFWYAAAR